MKTKQNFSRFIYVCLTLFLFVAIMLSGRSISPAYATTVGSSNVLEELQTDHTFDINDYPVINDKYSFEVIRVAESSGGQLYLYVYQPCQYVIPLVATQINMSLSDRLGGVYADEFPDWFPDVDKPKLYDLSLVNSYDVFQKYLVKNFEVGSDNVRYYNITSIYRPFNEDIDGKNNLESPVKYKAFEVGKLFTVEFVDGGVKYLSTSIDTIKIVDPFVDHLSSYGGYSISGLFSGVANYFDVHYVAFSTDMQIDELIEVDLTYTTQSYSIYAFSDDKYGAVSKPKYLTLTQDSEIVINVSSLGGVSSYTWKSILRSEDFIEVAKLNKSTASTVKKSDYVLVFLSTKHTSKKVYSFSQGHGYNYYGTKVSDVSILRLEFKSGGRFYNFGAVMDIQEGDYRPGNAPDFESIGFWAYIWRCIVRLFKGTASLKETVVAILVLMVVFVALPVITVILSVVFPPFGQFLKVVFKAIGKALWWLVKGLLWLLYLPVRGIKALINKIRGG